MIRILIFLAIVSALAVGAVWLADRPGEVAIVWQGLRIETTVAMAVIAVGLLVVAGMLLWSIARFLLGLPTAFSFASRARQRARGFEAVSRGMVAVGAGDSAAARRYASDARKLMGDEPLPLLLTAQAAQLTGDKPAAEEAFKSMLDDPDTRVLGLRGLFVEARRRGDMAAARAFADEAVRLAPSLAWANDALLEYHTGARDWTQARIAVERRASLRLSDKAESARHRAVLLAAEALELADSDPATALSTALDAVKLAPGLVPAAALAGELLARRGDLRKASKILEAAWREQPHPDLARVYLNVRPGDATGDKLERALTLSRLAPADPESALTLAKAAVAAREFQRARDALKPLLAAVPTVRTCLIMAAIEDGEFGSQGRAREWLARAARAPRDPAWIGDGIVTEHWQPVSPATGRLDGIVWAVPPAAISASVDEAALLLEAGPAPAALAQDIIPLGLPSASSSVLIDTVPAASARTASTLSDPASSADPATLPTPPQASGETSQAPGPADPATAPSATSQPPAAGGAPLAFLAGQAPDDPGPEIVAPAKGPDTTRRRFWPFG